MKKVVCNSMTVKWASVTAARFSSASGGRYVSFAARTAAGERHARQFQVTRFERGSATDIPGPGTGPHFDQLSIHVSGGAPTNGPEDGPASRRACSDIIPEACPLRAAGPTNHPIVWRVLLQFCFGGWPAASGLSAARRGQGRNAGGRSIGEKKVRGQRSGGTGVFVSSPRGCFTGQKKAEHWDGLPGDSGSTVGHGRPMVLSERIAYDDPINDGCGDWLPMGPDPKRRPQGRGEKLFGGSSPNASYAGAALRCTATRNRLWWWRAGAVYGVLSVATGARGGGWRAAGGKFTNPFVSLRAAGDRRTAGGGRRVSKPEAVALRPCRIFSGFFSGAWGQAGGAVCRAGRPKMIKFSWGATQ